MSYPRRVGSPGEARARAFLNRRLRMLGCEVEEQPFECSTGPDIAIALLLGAAQVLIVLTFWAWSGWPGLAVLPALLLLLLVGFAGRLSRAATRLAAGPVDVAQTGSGQSPLLGLMLAALRWPRRLGRRYATANLVARWQPPAAAAAPHLYLVAHWDSKSQVLPLVVRIGLIAVAVAAASVFEVLTLFRMVWPAVTSAAAVSGLIALLAGAPVLLLYLAGAGNASPGAVDNASGAGLLLHLAEHFCQDAPPVRLTFVFTGAEELGLQGAAAFVQAAAARGEWDAPERVRVLNLDGIGTDGPLAYIGSANAAVAQAVRAVCAARGWQLQRLPLVGTLYDHLPFADAGLDAISLVTTGAAVRSVHTPSDSAERLSEAGFRWAGTAVLGVVEQLAGGWAPSPASRDDGSGI
ncbi:MAG: M28 family peptidase [Anaerolineales bacterium]|nr:M28 family peptidase [Anaerolineales bacterium]